MPHPDKTPTGGGPATPYSRRDRTILQRAARQHGIVARRQLLADGVPDYVIAHRLRSGQLSLVHRGVYRCGPVAAPYSREMAAMLACGRRATISHRTAAVIWELIPPQRATPPVDVTTPVGLRIRPEGVRIHRARRLHADEVCCKHGLQVTTPLYTLLQLATNTGFEELERVLARAERRCLVTREDLEDMLKRRPRRPGNAALGAILRLKGGPSFTRSEAEARFLSLVRRGDLPRPSSNMRVEGFELDFLWRSQGLVVEIDGFAYHRGRDAFERDRRRDAKLTAAGFRVFRVTWRQLVERPEALLVRLTQALGAQGD